MTVYRGGGVEEPKVRRAKKIATGAWSTKKEQKRSIQLHTLRSSYEASGGPPLSVKVLGNPNSPDFRDIPRHLAENGAGELEIGNQIRIGLPSIIIHATRSDRAIWIMIEDVVGWVNLEPRKEVEAAISSKASKLSAYQERVGADVRLLIIAEDRFNSGKLRPHNRMSFNGHGFREIYFFNSPSGPFQTLDIRAASDGHIEV